MKFSFEKLPVFIFGFFIFLIYSSWFFSQEIIGGDWPYYYKGMVKEFYFFAPLWNSQAVLGGVNQNFSLFSYHNFIAAVFSNLLHIPWNITYKIFWFGLFIFLSIFSIWCLVKTIFKKSSIIQTALSIFIYIANTYILMIVGGGQIGIALAYSIAPLVLALFIKLLDHFSISSKNIKYKILNIKYPIIVGLVLSVQVLFDLRISYITIIFVFIYYFIGLLTTTRLDEIKKLFYIFIIPFTIIILLHVYWLFPFIYFHLFSVPEGITSVGGFSFFSFSDFSHAISLLHSNWPENIFGKTYFLKPEFLILPILAYSSLLFIRISKTKLKSQNIVFFIFLGLLGAFLAKGVNPPFGEINQFLFQYIPGMNMFRDPTKFYLMIVLSYSVLIPFSINSIYEELKSKIQIKIQNYFPFLFLLLTICYLIFLVWPALMRELGGTFKSYTAPEKYLELNSFINSQNDFFGTLWVPTQSRFRIQTEKHPLLNADYLFKTGSNSLIVEKLKEDKTEILLEKLGIKYIIIPYDSTGEIFLTDRKYDKTKRVKIEKELDKIKWLKKVKSGEITVYETKKHKDNFWLEKEGKISYTKTSNYEYEISVENLVSNKIIFADSYNQYLRANIHGKIINSEKTEDGFNSFKISAGNYKIRIYFLPQQFVNLGYFFSGAVLILLTVFLI